MPDHEHDHEDGHGHGHDDRHSGPALQPLAALKGQLATGVVRLVDANKVVLGYAFTEATSTGQMQRWLLYADPRNAFSIVADPEKADWTLATWKDYASRPVDKGGLWKADSFYVWSQANVYLFGGTYDGVVWNKIPDPLPDATYPAALRAQPSPYQLDDGTGKIGQGSLVGYTFSVLGVSNPSNAEYWVLPAGYVGAGALQGPVTTITPTTNFGFGLSGFISGMNKTAWRKGSALSITGNTNYRGVDPPSNP